VEAEEVVERLSQPCRVVEAAGAAAPLSHPFPVEEVVGEHPFRLEEEVEVGDHLVAEDPVLVDANGMQVLIFRVLIS
jgi:hypothetical protein